tara:strand:+ start:74 stop:493 length:420 start_codon:yes stop_codon:yes gene_type:complete
MYSPDLSHHSRVVGVRNIRGFLDSLGMDTSKVAYQEFCKPQAPEKWLEPKDYLTQRETQRRVISLLGEEEGDHTFKILFWRSIDDKVNDEKPSRKVIFDNSEIVREYRLDLDRPLFQTVTKYRNSFSIPMSQAMPIDKE